jgi:hypothetical protein
LTNGEQDHEPCLNCGATLTGRFCAECGQRVLPRHPALRELARDAWDEFAGYDGRFARTIRLLLSRPGGLTLEVLNGRRNRYISPVRLYLFASFLYFLIAAFAPPLSTAGGLRSIGTDGQREVLELDALTLISDEDRAEGLKAIERAPGPIARLLRPIFTDPVGFRSRLLENIPRVLFLLVPVFAAAVGLFFAGGALRHVVFSLHVHAAVFLMLVPRELMKFTGSVNTLRVIQALAVAAAGAYVLIAARRVYSDRWGWLLLKAIPVAIVYLLAYAVALIAALAWTATS